VPIPVDFSEGAAKEIDDAFLCYLEHSVGVADSFAAEVERAITLIAEAPRAWPEYEPGFRSYVLRRFPYTLIYSHGHDWAEPREGIVRIINARMATRREVQLFQRRMEGFR
jgi:plasmid stabilization system protein ParE